MRLYVTPHHVVVGGDASAPNDLRPSLPISVAIARRRAAIPARRPLDVIVIGPTSLGAKVSPRRARHLSSSPSVSPISPSSLTLNNMSDTLPPFLVNTTTVAVPGERTITVYTAGPASSTDVVLLESGLGQGAAYWGAVVDAITVSAPTLRVVGYDRAGYGKSTPPTDDRSLHAMAADLSSVVSSLGASRLVLVGHSWGGPIIRTYAASSVPGLHGMVLVDHSDEHCASYFSRSMSWAFWLQSWLYQPLAAVGLLGMMMRRMGKGLPEAYASRSIADSTSASAARAGALEVSNVASLRELLTHPPELGDTPLIVISAKDGGPHKDGSMRALLAAAHRETAASVKNGTFVLAEKSGHIVPIDEPGLVAGHIVSLFRPSGRTNAD